MRSKPGWFWVPPRFLDETSEIWSLSSFTLCATIGCGWSRRCRKGKKAAKRAMRYIKRWRQLNGIPNEQHLDEDAHERLKAHMRSLGIPTYSELVASGQIAEDGDGK